MSCASPYILTRGICFTNSTAELNATSNTPANSDSSNSGGQITIQSTTTATSSQNTSSSNLRAVSPTLC